MERDKIRGKITTGAISGAAFRHPFALSADLLAVTELIGVIVAAVAIWDDKEDNEN